jgi:hypothetical protein
MKAPKKSQSNRKQISKATLINSTHLHRLRRARIAKDIAAEAKKKRAATGPIRLLQNRLNPSKKRKARSQNDNRGSKRSRVDDSGENEENSDDSESGGGDEAAPGLSSNSANNTALGETQDNPRTPLRRSMMVTRTKKIFCVSFSTRRQAILTK